MKTILTVVGARPQFIKASVLSRLLQAEGGSLREVMVHTGQHTDDRMSAVFFSELGIPEPAYTLPISAEGVLARAGEMLTGLQRVIEAVKPDAILVYGDTDSTLAGAWAAARLGLPLIHVEAGLRSADRQMPEEINRIGADHWATHLCCPSEDAAAQLRNEGIFTGDSMGREVAVVGDLQCDAALFAGSSQSPSGPVVLTLHRPSNVDDPVRLKAWLEAVGNALKSRGLRALFPVHPRTEKVLEQIWGSDWGPALQGRNIDTSAPLGYMDLMEHVGRTPWVLTDSGGLQKEAYVLGRRSVVLRPVTEWRELVEHGIVVCAGEPEDLEGRIAEIEANRGWPESALYGAGEAGPRLKMQLDAWLS